MSLKRKRIPEIIDELPNICGFDEQVVEATTHTETVYENSTDPLEKVQSAFVIALHMHQHTIPAGGDTLSTAPLISNLEHMFDNPHVEDNHNAPGSRLQESVW